eukprot:766957-Hanusia_phi.AAC.4
MRSQNPKSDMINRPGSTDGCWIWRCHKRMEDLIDNSKFNDFIKNMLKVFASIKCREGGEVTDERTGSEARRSLLNKRLGSVLACWW